jgi:phosphoglucosamine mutase
MTENQKLTLTKKYFGTDGVRGTVGKFPMTAEIAMKIGIALGIKFCHNKSSNENHRILIGKDTRLSGYLIESALTAGLTSTGAEVYLVGPMPTPAIAMLTKSMRATLGIMISASHNPYHDNGIKIFSSTGDKLSDEEELSIEDLLDSDLKQHYSSHENIGKVKRIEDAKGRYIEFVKQSLAKNINFNNLRVVVDCANGAAYNIAPLVLGELGAKVIAIGNNPDGININDNCGSTNLTNLQNAVLEHKANIGLALDGDADRIAAVDEMGQVINGDKIIAIIADYLHNCGQLKNDKVIITQMSNIALENYLAYIGVKTVRVNIGDRYILEGLKQHQANFGGEQSGHIIMQDYSNTGDGLIAGLKLLEIMQKSGQKISELANIFQEAPQILVNIEATLNQVELLNKQHFLLELEKHRSTLKNKGRILVRKSGTENLVRIMVEGESNKQITDIANQIATFIKNS